MLWCPVTGYVAFTNGSCTHTNAFSFHSPLPKAVTAMSAVMAMSEKVCSDESISRSSIPNTPVQVARSPHAGGAVDKRESSRSAACRSLSLRDGLCADAEMSDEATQCRDNNADAMSACHVALGNGACMQSDGVARAPSGVSNVERQNEPLLQDNEDRFCMYPIRCYPQLVIAPDTCNRALSELP